MKAFSIKKSDLIIATSILCEVCFQREETCKRVTVSFFKKGGWKKVDNLVRCPDCLKLII